ncbi:hypothetical protein NLO98_21385, partial [Pseudomonas syringae]|nr:hypothetical protein [Pseudomonas syringae]
VDEDIACADAIASKVVRHPGHSYRSNVWREVKALPANRASPLKKIQKTLIKKGRPRAAFKNIKKEGE